MRILLSIATAAAISATAASAAPGVEHWSASSTTAIGVTGNIALSPALFTAAGKTLRLAVAADVASFPINGSNASARIFRVVRPGDPLLLNNNHLCGAAVRWIVAQRGPGGKDLTLAIFSSAVRPVSDASPGLCATFGYAR